MPRRHAIADDKSGDVVYNKQTPVDELPNPPSGLIELGEKIYTPQEAPLDHTELAKRIYDRIQELEEKNKVTFVSHIRGLNLAIQVYRPREDGKIITESKIIEFYQGQYTTSDPYIIEALRREPTYGGTGDTSPSPSKSPLFWESSFPQWMMQKIEIEEKAKQKVPYEESEITII